MTEHSPLPWSVEHDDYGYEVKDADGTLVMSSTTLDVPCQHIPPRAIEVPRIVRAVNLHDELVQALEKLVGECKEYDKWDRSATKNDLKRVYGEIDALLAKAKGEA